MPGTDIVIPMSATIVEIAVATGTAIRERQVVATVEAMKMEHEIRAERDGVVAEILVEAGDVVDRGAVLMRVDARDAAPLSSDRHRVDASPLATIAWPTGEFGAMGLEGAVKLVYRKELEAATDEGARNALYAKLVAEQCERGGALNMAATLEIDAVIDPAETRAWLARGLAMANASERDAARRFIDPW